MSRYGDVEAALRRLDRQIADEEARLDRLKERHRGLRDTSRWSLFAQLVEAHGKETIEEEIYRAERRLSELRERWADLADDLYLEDVGEIEDEGW